MSKSYWKTAVHSLFIATAIGACALPAVAVEKPAKAALSGNFPSRWVPAYSSVPPNWVVTNYNSNNWLISDVTSAATGEYVYVYFSTGMPVVAIPEGWIISQAGSVSNQITKIVGSPAWTTYWAAYGSPIPEGWVITEAGSVRNQLTNVNGVPDYSTAYVNLGSPIPKDWVITTAGAVKNTITKVKDVPNYTAIWVMIGSPIPDGWVITTAGSLKNEITKVKTLPVGTEIWTAFGSPVPLGWEIKTPGQLKQLIVRRY